MKLYKSLIYRELKLTRRHYLLMLILFLLMLICILIPVILSGDEEPDAAADSSGLVMLGLMVSMVGGAAAGLDNELHKADINVGWRRYRIVLPPTASQNAAVDLLVKLIYVLVFGVLTGAFCVLINIFADGMDVLAVMNQFLMFTTVFFLFSLVFNGILMLAKDEKDIKKYGTIASIAVVALYILLSRALGSYSMGKLLGKAKKFLGVMGSATFTAIALALFVCVCAAHFIVMWRAYERREP